MHKPEYTPAINGLDTGIRVHHIHAPSIHGTITQMAVFTARVQWDNGVDAWQSISVLRPVPPVHCECGCTWEGPEEQTVQVCDGARRIRVERVCAARMVSLGRGRVSVL